MLKEFTQKVVVVGCGGIGSWLIPPLCRFLQAERYEGPIVLCDGDVYEVSNATRQEFNESDLGQNKASAQAGKLYTQYPLLRIESMPEYVTDDNVEDVISDNSVVFVCVDNHPARARIDKAALLAENCCVFSAGNEEFDGNVCSSLRIAGRSLSLPLLERHPEVGKSKANDRGGEHCEDLVAEGFTQLLSTNLMAATGAFVMFSTLWRPMVGKTQAAPKQQRIPQDLYFSIPQLAMSTVGADGR